MFAGQLQRSRRCIASSGHEQSNIPRATSRVCSLRRGRTGVTGSKRKRQSPRKHPSYNLTPDAWISHGSNKSSKDTRVCEYGGMRPACKLHTCSFPLAGTKMKTCFQGVFAGSICGKLLQDVFCVARVSDRILTVLVRVILSPCGRRADSCFHHAVVRMVGNKHEPKGRRVRSSAYCTQGGSEIDEAGANAGVLS